MYSVTYQYDPTLFKNLFQTKPQVHEVVGLNPYEKRTFASKLRAFFYFVPTYLSTGTVAHFFASLVSFA